MGVAGATVSSETADAVITIDRIDRAPYTPVADPSTSLARASSPAWA